MSWKFQFVKNLSCLPLNFHQFNTIDLIQAVTFEETTWYLCGVYRGFGWSEEPQGVRSNHQLPQGALGAGRRQRSAVSHLLRPRIWRSRGHGEADILQILWVAAVGYVSQLSFLFFLFMFLFTLSKCVCNPPLKNQCLFCLEKSILEDWFFFISFSSQLI